MVLEISKNDENVDLFFFQYFLIKIELRGYLVLIRSFLGSFEKQMSCRYLGAQSTDVGKSDQFGNFQKLEKSD